MIEKPTTAIPEITNSMGSAPSVINIIQPVENS
jgi:hypothetical protein